MALLGSSQRNYLDGISPFAIEMAGLAVGSRLANLNSDGLYSGPITGKGEVWYVDSTVTSSGAGTSWATAFKTIAEAVAAATGGDTIKCSGSFSEGVTISATSCAGSTTGDGLILVGVGTAEKQCQWTKATGAASTCLTISGADYVTVMGFYFRPPAYSVSGVPAAILLSDAQHTRIIGNRFQGRTDSYKAIYSAAADSDNTIIANNVFIYLNTATHGGAIVGVSTGGFAYSGWQILNNWFSSCVTAIDLNLKCSRIEGNTIEEYGLAAAGGAVSAVLALGIDLTSTSGGGGGANTVTGNFLGGAYTSTLYKVNADVAGSDSWMGNRVTETATTAPYGLSMLNPA